MGAVAESIWMHLQLQQHQQQQPIYKKKHTTKSLCFSPKSLIINNNNNNGGKKVFFPTNTSLVSLNNNTSISVVAKLSSSAAAEAAAVPPLELGVGEIKNKCKKWLWKGQFSINYLVEGEENQESKLESKSNPPLLLVHGFGASIPHWRRNIRTLAQNHTVYAIDLLGFGASDKPEGFPYTMETWAQLILDFLDEIVKKPTVLVGNSVGSLACLIAASESNQSLVRGLVLLNCAGGMNNKAVVDDWRIKLFKEQLLLIFSSVLGRGPPGPNPVKLMPKISIPVLLLWGNQDPFTPLDGPVGKYFSALPAKVPSISLFVLEGVGHCPHDDEPELVHEKLLPWLAQLPASSS
ncbi:hypothetical protein F8388_012047 [Cannabis sativa]|uniref:AB hydrolase-1 domain-containing protein n=1 Tax=Cannabis sativa TaxID=3483 RepID=A0A7J6GDV3_CANSA|nr:hypothetical protein F8388_012047 [Cannabis sativa]